MEMIGKISIKGIGAQPAPGSVKEPREIAKIFGSARQFAVGTTTYGDFVKFKGDFEAINMATGETFRSNSLLVPQILENMLVQALLDAGARAGKTKTAKDAEVQGDPATAPVEFAVIVGVRPAGSKDGAAPAGTGYEFTLKPLVELRDSDPLAHLRQAVQGIAHEKSAQTGDPEASQEHSETGKTSGGKAQSILHNPGIKRK